ESADDIFVRWPKPFKAIFGAELVRQGGKDAVDRYAAFGYPLPKAARSLRMTSSSPFVAGWTSPDFSADARTFSQSDAEDAEPSAEAASLRKTLKQMLAVLNTERAAHVQRVEDSQQRWDAERNALGNRIGELSAALAAERAAFARHIHKLQETMLAERVALTNRVDELDEILVAERTALSDRIDELPD